MSVEAFTVDGKITLDTSQFVSAISEVTNELSLLNKGLDFNFSADKVLRNMNPLFESFNILKESALEINRAFSNMDGIMQMVEAIQYAKDHMSELNVQVGEVHTKAQETGQVLMNWNEVLATVSPNFQNMVGSLEMMNTKEQERITALGEVGSLLVEENSQVKTNLTYYEQELQVAKQFENAEQGLIRGYAEQGRMLDRLIEKGQKRIQQLEREMQEAKRIGSEYMKIAREQNRQLTYEQEMLMVERQFNTEVKEYWEMKNAINEANARDMELLEAERLLEQEILTVIEEQDTGILSKLRGNEDNLAILREELSLEEAKLGVIEEETAMLNEQGAVRQRNATKGNQLDKMGYLPSRIGSMAVTMWGFNEIMDIYDKSMQNINAQGQMKTYTDLMKTDNRYLTQTKQDVNDIDKGINELNKSINETYNGGMSLQKMYQKVDMQSVGANAMDSAFKYGVQADKLDELTEVMAIYGSEFVRQGRSQEDSILAVNDALDGEYRRLKEVNIGKEELEEHGYEEGDTVSMIKALREIAEERGYDVVAQKITNLSDAITVLEIRIAQDLVGAFKVLEPVLTEVANDFIYMLDTFEWAFSGVRDAWNKFTTELDKTFGVQNVQKFGGGMLKFVGWAITLGITFLAVYKIVKSLKGMFSGLFGILGKGTDDIAKTTGDVAKTGGTVSSGGGFKDNFMKQWGKLGNDLGKIARVFIDVAVVMVGAFLLIEEAILMISAIGYTYESLKPQFESGIDFIKEYGLMLALLGGAMLGLSYVIGKIPDSAMTTITKGAKTLAMGMAIAMLLVAEAIVLLNAPLLAIASIGLVTEWTQDQIDDGMKTIHMFADALNYIANNDAILTFVLAFVGLSAILGYATETGIGSLLVGGLALGIAESLLLVAEAIGMLIVPLGAIALLGYSAESLDQANIQKGADTIRLIGDCLQALEPSIRNLLFIDMETFGINLVDWANKFITGKTGLESLVQDILPNLINFVRDFNELDMSGAESVDATKVQAITQMATDIPPLFTAIQKLNSAMGTSDMFGNIGGAVGGFVSGSIGMGLKSKLDQLYNDIKDVMDFANKLGTLQSSGNGANANAITSIANAITQLKAKLDLMVSTVGTASVNLQSASKQLGSALTTGFKDGSSGFVQSVVGVLAKGISEVQQRYQTWHNGGKASAEQLAKGFETIGNKFKSTISTEMGYALAELDKYKDDFYNKGHTLGDELTRGFQDGMDFHSPALISRTIAQEMEYSMMALDRGKQLMYSGGVALGQALVNGYQNYGNLRTDVGVLAQKGVSNEQLQATARKVQANTNNKGQTQQSLTPIINIDMSNSMVIGIQDLDARIKESVERAIISINSPNGAIGY